MTTRSRQRRIAAIEQNRRESSISEFSATLWRFRLEGSLWDRIGLVRILLWGVPKIDREDTEDFSRSRRSRARLSRFFRLRWRYHLWRIFCYAAILASMASLAHSAFRILTSLFFNLQSPI